MLNKRLAQLSKTLDELRNFDVASISPEQKSKIEQAALELNMTVEAMAKKSKAGGGILSWCYAVMELAGIAPDYNRQKQRVEESKGELIKSPSKKPRPQTAGVRKTASFYAGSKKTPLLEKDS